MENTMEKSLSRRMAEFTHSLTYDQLPAEVVRQVKRFLYDSVGCAYGGYHTPDVQALLKIYRRQGGTEEATIIGYGDRMPAVNATLVNSLMIRALDFNDIYWKEDPSHPSDLIPAALSVGEMVNASMEEVITAVVIAYEFEQRLCEFAVPGIRERKWHHATLTQLFSPLVAGKLLGLSVDQLVNAVGINGAHNHTIGCPTAGQLTMMKNTVDPLAVQTGVFAALMAAEGYTGTEQVFEGKEGFMDVFGPRWDEDKLVGGLGESYRILQCGMKAFPTEALSHTHLTTALKLVRTHDIRPDEIARVQVYTIARAADILFDPQKYRPQSRETADHSLPYCLAVCLVDREITTNSFSEEKMQDGRIWQVIDKIEGAADPEFEKMFPAKQPSRVVITTNDGRRFEHYLEYPQGDPREPISPEDLEAKFNSLAQPLFGPERLEALKELIFGCEQRSCREFMSALVV